MKRPKPIRRKGATIYMTRYYLGWSQAEMAQVLQISRGACSLIEEDQRTINQEVWKKVDFLKKMVDLQLRNKSTLMEDRLKSASKHHLAALTKYIQSAERKILHLEPRVAMRQRNTKKAIYRENELREQHIILTEIEAPSSMILGTRVLLNQQINKRLKYDLDHMHIMEATLVGKKAELEYLRGVLKGYESH